jgi:cell wall-associated NlpC family hydrolase
MPYWAAVVTLSLAACRAGDRKTDAPAGPAHELFADYYQVPLDPGEVEQLLTDIQGVLGYPYTWGGDTRTNGFDCSGLIQWAYRQAGYDRFRNGDAVYHEIAAHELYQYNVAPLEDLDQMVRGYFIFFDESGDGRITHNAVFDHQDGAGRVWVYDAYSVMGVVTHRPVDAFWDKGPRFGQPLKTLRL